jgi:competence protein ComEC
VAGVPFLPVVVAAAILAGLAAGAALPAWRFAAATLAALAWTAAVATARRRRGCALGASVTASVAGLGLVGAALGGVAMDRLLQSSLVQALAAAGGLDGDSDARPTARLEGRLAADASASGYAVFLRLDVERLALDGSTSAAPATGRVLLAVSGRVPGERLDAWRAGRRVAAVATLRRPTAYRNLGAADPARQMARGRAAIVGAVKSAMLVDDLARGGAVSEAAAAVRGRARRAIATAAGAETDAAALGTAVLIGDRAGLAPGVIDDLQRAGTYHVVAISGGNIALWALATWWITTRFTRRRSVALITAAVALAVYAGIVGGGASVLRATGMALVGLAARGLDQRAAAVNVLACAVALLAVADPLVVLDAGFWLSTIATLGLLVGLPSDPAAEPCWRAWTRAVVRASLWAEIALLPIVALVFQQVTLAGVVLSLAAIPAMAVAQVAALVAVTGDLVAPWMLPLAGLCLHGAAAVVTGSARLVDAVPWLAWHVPPPSVGALVAYYAAVGGWLWSRRTTAAGPWVLRLRRTTAWATPIAVVWTATAPHTFLPHAPGDLRLTMLDVGQGESTLVQFPDGRRMLVDAGGVLGDGRDAGGRVVAPALRARGIRRLDYVVVTHADRDHIGGAATIVRDFRPREVWVGIPAHEDRATPEVHAAAASVGAAWREVRRGERVAIGGVDVRVRHPPPPEWERLQVRNDDSVVLALRYGGAQVLLTGDIGAGVEAEVADGLARDDAGAGGLTIATVAHHGSAQSSSDVWLRAVQPRVALVSAGRGNPFGHPAAATLARLARQGVALWRTDQDGEINVRTDGTTIEVSSHAGRTRLFRIAAAGDRLE